ncbi:hypothetical protein KW843_22900 [Acidovorax sp. sif1233]|uniref:hypothetical protein n=1 Tax=Acidovorax sp. sif1233 TaxID=2854792 RepID=UPI001C4775B8|nr:hypothetical protein [Acidovorax sp. sif1233]MBV7457347.1 hypothetical protein [Acidovorax sp. sif1233]
MNSLIQQVRTAQVRAGEDAVLANLRSLGLVNIDPEPMSQREQNMAMFIRRIVSSARRHCEDGSPVLQIANEAWKYLHQNGLHGSPLRDASPDTPAVHPEAAQVGATLDPDSIEQGEPT